ncbi:unnamed protein product [Sphenostylis stenocarpa]|uniref:Uncharacterized protein n=1 Tax=Sphenostylis stenocarpa TaxID=92480 RepID=A0AA86TPW4_9FABA|nr:unnamed protein product [Sphenostylis stenocarpa]
MLSGFILRPGKIWGLQLPPLYPTSRLLAFCAEVINWRVKELTLLPGFPSDTPSLRRMILWEDVVLCASGMLLWRGS